MQNHEWRSHARPAPLPDTLDTIRRDLDALVSSQPAQIRSADKVGISDVVPNHPDPIGVVAVAARTLHLRRQLAQAAEHGAALLASLGLPRMVTPDFVALDPAVIGEAVDAAVAALDDLDADPDLEDGADDELSLGWEKPSSQLFLTEGAFSGDRELDTADAEPSLASPERHPAVPISTWGRAWTARGGEEGQLRWAEGAQDDRELVPEDGAIDEDELDGAGEVDAEPSIGWPEDFTAEVEATLEASADVEHDDADLEDDVDDDPGAEPWWSFDRSTVIEVVPHV